MDKRTILFVISLSATLFLVNIFFQHQNNQKKQEWAAQQQVKQKQKDLRLKEEIAQRTALPENLPLAKLYRDSQGNDLLSLGIFNQNNVLALAWQSPQPSSVFVQAPHSDQLQEYQLAGDQKISQGPVIYKAPSSSALQISSLSSTGHYDLQLIYLDPQDPSTLDIDLGEYIDGNFSIPQSLEKEGMAIALIKTSKDYLPVAIYDSIEKRLIPLKEIENLTSAVKQSAKDLPLSTKKGEEKFYVLETPYQQLVFSNRGGALAEINLAFQSKDNELSVVKEVEADREMLADHHYNDYFPSHPYYTPAASVNEQLTFHEQGKLGGYYPLLRRDLIEKAPLKTIQVKPSYYALNIISEYPELAEMTYEVKQFNEYSITFEAVQYNRTITKTYFLGNSEQAEGPYCLTLDIKIEGDARGLWLTSGVPEAEWISGGLAPSLKFRLTRNNKSEVEKIELPKDSITVNSTYLDWICNSNGFLGLILDPLKETEPGYRIQFVSGHTVPSRLAEFDQNNDRFKLANLPGYMTLLPLKSQGGLMKFRLFAGPFDTNTLKQVDSFYSDSVTQYNPDYIACQTMHGWFTFISEPFAKFLFVLMNLFHSITGSWALSIVLLTISLRIMLYPLNAWSTKSMVKMQQISPEVAAIQERNKKDPKKAQIEIMNLYREKGINPASGCLPLLIQMPFLVGMFDLLKSSFALRGAPFIPGWIDDLTAPDVLFRWKTPIFFIRNEFHLLPILLGLVMFAQQRLMATGPKDPSLMTDQQRQQRMMGTMMTVVFSVMFYNFPSGLNIYWLFSMLLGMLQQWITAKRLQKQPVVLPANVKGFNKKK